MSYAKALLAVVAAIISAIVAVLTDNVITPEEWVNVAIAGVGAITIALAANMPAGRWAYVKFYIAGLTAGLTFLASAITGGLSGAELMQLLVVVLGGAGVFAVSNRAG